MKISFNKTIYRIVSLLLISVCLFGAVSLSGCGGDDFNLYFGVDQLPKSIDPQRASLYSELLAVKNCFIGLMKLDTNGEPQCGVAEDHTVSDDGCTYTFNLGDSKWSNGDSVTAYDFEFAVKRACMPETKATGTESLLNITGASELLNGGTADLGFYAEDEDTVIINLLKPDSNFLHKLTEAVFMPCNEEFFEGCKGKYGLGTDYIITNGNFKVASWSEKGNFVRLNRVVKSDGSAPHVKSVYLSMGTSGKDTVTRINDGEIGMTLNHTDDYTTVNTSKYTYETTYLKNYIIVFNKESAIGSNELMTKAFQKSVDRDYLSTRLDSRFKLTRSVLPETAVLNGNIIGDIGALPQSEFVFSAAEARTMFLEALKALNSGGFPDTKVLTVDNASVTSALTDVVTQWQRNLGAYINIKTVSNEDELLSAVKSKNYTIAFIPVSNDVTEVLHLFTNGGAADIKSEEFNSIVTELDNTYNASKSDELLQKALEILSADPSVIPIFSQPSAAIWDSSYKNVYFNKTDMTVDFSLICK